MHSLQLAAAAGAVVVLAAEENSDWFFAAQLPNVTGTCNPGRADEVACLEEQCTSETCLGLGDGVLAARGEECEGDALPRSRRRGACSSWVSLKTGAQRMYRIMVYNIAAGAINTLLLALLLAGMIFRDRLDPCWPRLRPSGWVPWRRLHWFGLAISSLCWCIDIGTQLAVIWDAHQLGQNEWLADPFRCVGRKGYGIQVLISLHEHIQDAIAIGQLSLAIAVLGLCFALQGGFGEGGLLAKCGRWKGVFLMDAPQALLNVLILAFVHLAIGFVDLSMNTGASVDELEAIETAVANGGSFANISAGSRGHVCVMLNPSLDFEPRSLRPAWLGHVGEALVGITALVGGFLAVMPVLLLYRRLFGEEPDIRLPELEMELVDPQVAPQRSATFYRRLMDAAEARRAEAEALGDMARAEADHLGKDTSKLRDSRDLWQRQAAKFAEELRIASETAAVLRGEVAHLQREAEGSHEEEEEVKRLRQEMAQLQQARLWTQQAANFATTVKEEEEAAHLVSDLAAEEVARLQREVAHLQQTKQLLEQQGQGHATQLRSFADEAAKKVYRFQQEAQQNHEEVGRLRMNSASLGQALADSQAETARLQEEVVRLRRALGGKVVGSRETAEETRRRGVAQQSDGHPTVYVRGSPQGSTVGRVPNGTAVIVCNEIDDAYKVEIASAGLTGWVKRSDIQLDGEAETAGKSQSLPSSAVFG